MATNKRKTTTAIVAGVTALALLLGGTFAWTSISQQARNEAIVDINPGGRLHDDFNGTNKDVYVENFGDELTGVNIYARIKLTEYMEVGPDAGKDKNGTDRNVKVIYPDGVEQPVINDPDTWITYIPAKTDPAHTKDVNQTVYTNYWDWELGKTGDLPYYMPTFNMNKDSLLADINGTYEGTVEGDIVHYDNYVEYKDGDSKNGTEIYDWDSDTKDEDGGVITEEYDNDGVTYDDTTPIDDADVYHKENQKHPAKQISTDSTVITMQQWLAPVEEGGKGGQPGPFWVYDEDGWAYWAQPIAPQTTTGLLLDSIKQTRVPDDNWYYGIDVVGQFVTASDLSAFENANNSFSDNAKELMGAVAKIDNELELTGPVSIVPGTSASYNATFKASGVALEKQPEFAWEITDVTAPADAAALLSDDTGISIKDGEVTVDSNVAVGTTFKVNATAGALTKELTVTVAEQAVAADETITIRNGESKAYSYIPGEAKTFKIVLDTEDDGEDGEITDPSAFDIWYAYDKDFENNYAEDPNQTLYSFDPDTDILTINATANEVLNFNFQYDEFGAAYEFTLMPVVEKTLDVNYVVDIAYTAELVFDFEEPDEMGGFFQLNFKDTEGAPITVDNLQLSGEYGDNVTWDAETNILYIRDLRTLVVLSAPYKDSQLLCLISSEWSSGYIHQITPTLSEEKYTQTVVQGGIFQFFDNDSTLDEESTMLLKFTDESKSVTDCGVSIINVMDLGSMLYIPDDYFYYDEAPDKITLTAIAQDKTEKLLEITVKESHDLQATWDIFQGQNTNVVHEGDITQAGIYRMRVNISDKNGAPIPKTQLQYDYSAVLSTGDELPEGISLKTEINFDRNCFDIEIDDYTGECEIEVTAEVSTEDENYYSLLGDYKSFTQNITVNITTTE